MNTADGPAIIRKISWRILPLIAISYLVAYLDRINISFAAIQMNEDLGFTATIYGFGAGMFFLSYSVCEIPSNILLTRVGPRRWFARIMITWGVLAAGMMFVQTPTQFYVMRFLLGIAEAGYFPGMIFYISRWFPMEHRGWALSKFYMAAPLGNLVMGAVSGWLLGMDGILGLRGWQWLFLIQGLPAVVLAVVVFFYLPDHPDDVDWLDDGEKQWLRDEHARAAAKLAQPVEHHMFAALKNPVVLQLSFMGFLTIGAYYAFVFSVPTLLTEVAKLNVTETGYLVSAGGLTGALSMLFTGWFSDRRGERFSFLLFATLGVAATFLVFAFTSSTLVIIITYLIFAGAWTTVTLSTWLVSTDVLHHRLLAVGSAAINTVAQIGGFVGPYLWGIARDTTGSYQMGLLVLTAVLLLAAATIEILRRQVMAAPRKTIAEAAEIEG